jgi:hypothetical protein
MSDPKVVRMYQAGNVVWINFNDLTRYLRNLPDTAPADFPEDMRNFFKDWTEMLLKELAESEPVWVKDTDLSKLQKEEP